MEFTKQFYKIKDVAEFVGVPATTLRYWESQFREYVAPIRNAGKIRYYTPQTIETLRLIKYLLYDRGMKIEAAKDELRHNLKNVSRRMKILTKLNEARDELQLLLKSLEKRRDV
ncbi:MAG: MerR family transcriptional regulator [Muribaculaceae bacterium]|nr:MerR family transcriptional regulator [Muribaculaceae bacterium]